MERAAAAKGVFRPVMQSRLLLRWIAIAVIALLVALALAASSVWAAPEDARMTRLAQESGCAFCHAARPEKPNADAVLPHGPAWSEIAARYRGQKGIEPKLVGEIMNGVGPENRHWQSGTELALMPENRVAISEKDANALVRWILRQKAAVPR